MRYAVIIVLAVLTLFAGSCGGSGQVTIDSVRIGAILSLSGQYQTYGQSIQRGIEIALENINNSGGLDGTEYKIIIEDSGSTIDGARAAFNKLVKDDVQIIIGPDTTELANALIPMAERNEVVLISPSATSTIEQSSNYFFRICSTDEAEMMSIVEDITRERREKWLKRSYSKALVLVRDKNEYCESLFRAIASSLSTYNIDYEPIMFDKGELQGALLDDQEYNETMQEILAAAENHQRVNDDPEKLGAIVVLGLAEDVRMILDALQTSEDEEYLVYASSAADNATFFRNAASIGENLILLFPGVFNPAITDNPVLVEFVELFEARFNGEEPDLYAAYGYDVASLIAETLVSAENLGQALKDPRNLRLSMNDIQFNGTTGAVNFNSQDHEVSRLPSLYVVSADMGIKSLQAYERGKLAEMEEQRQREIEALQN